MLNKTILIRAMVAADCQFISDAFTAQGWNKPVSQYLQYCQQASQGLRLNLLAEYESHFAGYVTVVWASDYAPFRVAGIPEIVDFNVLLKFRRLKIGTALLDEAERCISLRSPVAGLGVCLHHDYGAAQVLYALRGYRPDGQGVYYHGRYPDYGEQVTLDDDLVLYLTRQLR